MSTTRAAIGMTVLAATVLVAAGVAGGMALAPQQSPGSLGAAATDAVFPVASQPFDDARTVPVTPVLAAESTVKVADTGRITRSSCSPGGSIVSGANPLTVDDRPVLALATTVPMWRDLARGVKGSDVTSLQSELARLGYDVTADGEYGAGTKAAVADLQKKSGVAKPTGNLAMASVMWLPARSVAVKSCDLAVGDTAGTDAFATTAGTLTALRLGDVPLDAAPGDRVVRLDGAQAPVGADGTVTDPELLAAVAAGPEIAAWRASDGAGTLQVQYALGDPLTVSVVPPAALFGLSDGAGCVRSGGADQRVEVVASSLGQALVVPETGTDLAEVEIVPPGTSCA